MVSGRFNKFKTPQTDNFYVVTLIYSRVIQGVFSWYSGGIVGRATLIRGTTPVIFFTQKFAYVKKKQ